MHCSMIEVAYPVFTEIFIQVSAMQIHHSKSYMYKKNYQTDTRVLLGIHSTEITDNIAIYH